MAAGLRNKENNPGESMQRRWPALRGENVAVAMVHQQTEVVNGRFFGAMKENKNENEQKVKSGEGGGGKRTSSRLTEEWLAEAKRRVGANTLARHSSPAVLGRTVPRFAAAKEAAQLAERRDAHSRSARRCKGMWISQSGLGGLQKMATNHVRSPSLRDKFSSIHGQKGIVMALHGKEISDGNFFVEDIIEAGLPPQIMPSPELSILR